MSFTLDTTYSFQIEDYTPPRVSSAVALDLKTVRVTFNEAMTESAATDAASVLNLADWMLDRLGDYITPLVSASIVSIAVVSSTEVDLTTDIPLTPNGYYRVTVANAQDAAGNSIAAPYNTADFLGWVPPAPADRGFDLFSKLPSLNQREDDSEDLFRFIACCQEVVLLLLYDIDRFADIIDPDVAGEDFVDLMLEDLGNPFLFEELSLIDKRRLVQILVSIYKLKGTAVGIISAVRFFLGVEVTVEALNTLTGLWRLGVGLLGSTTVLGTGVTKSLYSFRIKAPGVVLTDDQRAKIKEIANYMKPAHTHLVSVSDTGQTISGAGDIASAELVEQPAVGYVVTESILSVESVPSPQVNLNVQGAVGSIASAESVSSPAIPTDIFDAGNIVSTESVSSPTLVHQQQFIFYPVQAVAPGGGSYGELQQDSTSDSGGVFVATGWAPGGQVSTVYSKMVFDAGLQGAGTFGASALPAPPLALSDAFRTKTAYTGTFVAGNWTFDLNTTDGASSVAGNLRFRIYRSVNADGSGATEITSGPVDMSAFSGALDHCTATVALGAVVLTGEYLFVQVAIKVTASSEASGRQLSFPDTTYSKLTPPLFQT